ncbi:hypothetical protein L4D06_06855 [Enterovibrio makurazakiensis]|uniref:hypothetical protein n=1 Tax=Enterovibrio makurazakiensis TaxID=2910232 RepID=UPI003D19379E
MALPKNKSRKIVVDDVEYRFAISISWKDNGEFDFNITVQSEKSNAGKLILKGLVTRNFWLDFSDLVGEKIKKDLYPTITPKHIEYFIKLAIDKGWKHSQNGDNFNLVVNNKQLGL